MSIRQLPEHVVDKLKSSVTITTLNGVACGLLTNALDAGASKVNISIDYTRGNCTVEDDGSGISRDEFGVDGGLGKLHHTSRYPTRTSIHGKHGNFLASVATFSLLTVTSRHQNSLSHNSITIHNSNVLARNLPALPEQRLLNFDYGTKVVVRDLFGSMPVRVKQRLTVNDRSALEREWTKLMREMTALLLAWPTSVTLSLRNTTTQRELRFRPPESSDVTSRTSRLLIQASLADSGDAGSWVPVSASSGLVTIKGCICETPAATRRSQFISFGIIPVINEYGTDVIYEEINRIFHNSSFGVIEEDEKHLRNSPKLDGFTTRELRSRKSIEKWPMFYFKILTSTPSDVDIDRELAGQSQTWMAILDTLKAACYGFLRKYHFRPKKISLFPDESVFSTSTAAGRRKKPSQGRSTPSSASSSRANSVPRHVESGSQPRVNNPFDGWHRVKMGRATPVDIKSPKDDQMTTPETALISPLVGEGGKLLRKPFEEPEPEPKSVAQSPDPASTNSASLAESEKHIDKQPKTQRSKWLQDAIASWENPVFEAVEALIPKIRDTNEFPHQCKQSDGIAFDAHSMNVNGRVTRHALARATVISQVDRKYILVKLPLEGSELDDAASRKQTSALVMLDQHAVDERCRLEDLMVDYFTCDPFSGITNANVEVLERPLVFEVTSKEHELLEQHRDHFASWGILYHLPNQPKQPLNEYKVIATGLPPSILERCRQEPRLLIELLRKQVWHLTDSNISSTRPAHSQTSVSWVSRFHGCPQGILEMLHSRACRSAIMFNDPLAHDECSQLVARLSRCAFPFQCAHGRPSMAPLVDLGAGGRFGRWQERKISEDRAKWKTWVMESANSDEI
ncbi:hypothetical protein BGZ63DRAFT_363451 [Mariannaea sp. PMI_226]|nr:hypothetical protein BGZ63DRAFT_363451 [Mariannaea sp. PMI_226]